MSNDKSNKIAEPDHTRGAQAVPRQPKPEPAKPAPAPAPKKDK